MYHNNEISIINLSRLQCIVSVSVLVSANNFSTNTRIGNIGKKWYRSISNTNLQSLWTYLMPKQILYLVMVLSNSATKTISATPGKP